MRACPALEKSKYYGEKPRAFIVQNVDDEIRRQSTSGGAFTAIANEVIVRGGVVFGAAMNEEFCVTHVSVESKSDLSKFRSSKYVQSIVGDAYQIAEKELKSGRQVLFSGTPCQIEGLKKYLRKEYENLTTVDVMCRAVPSPKILRKYIDYQKDKYPNFDRIVFRDKGRGYSYSCVTIYRNNKVVYRGGSESDPWLRLFLGGYCNRETCHKCLYQTGTRASDITLWDCWETQNYVPEWDDNKGTTNVITWTNKGYDIINSCVNELRTKEIGIENIDASLNRSILHRPNYNREKFFNDAEILQGKEFINKYAPMTYKVRIKKAVRTTMHSLHLHDVVRKMVHRIRKIKKGMRK